MTGTWTPCPSWTRWEPTGANFPPAAFMTRDLRVVSCRTVGADGKHLKLSLSRNGRRIDAIGFGMGELAADMPGSVDAAYQLELNEFNGRRSLQLHLLDIPSGAGMSAVAT